MIKLWELPPSPNNTKVFMALRFKGLEFETVPVDPADRGPLLEVSGQEGTPVIEDGGVVLNDSEAILQFLDANYRDRPRLFPPDKTRRRVCEDWKAELDRRLAAPWLPVFFYGIGRREELDPKARDEFEAALVWLEDELANRPGFDEGEMAINDLRVAEWATYAFPGPALIDRVPLFARFQKLYGIEPGRLPRLEAFLEPWQARLG